MVEDINERRVDANKNKGDRVVNETETGGKDGSDDEVEDFSAELNQELNNIAKTILPGEDDELVEALWTTREFIQPYSFRCNVAEQKEYEARHGQSEGEYENENNSNCGDEGVNGLDDFDIGSIFFWKWRWWWKSLNKKIK